MRRPLLPSLALLLLASPLWSQQTADDIVAKYVQRVGGTERIQAVKTLRRTGRFYGGGGFEAKVVYENKRPAMVREEFSFGGMTGVNAYDGKAGWKIEPWQGKKDAEQLSEDEVKGIVEDAEFEDPLFDFKRKGNQVELVGTDQIEGTDVFKLKVTYANGTVQYYYIDKDTYVPIKIDTKRMVRGAEREYEMTIGDYKPVAGWYLPFSIETNVKGSSDRAQVLYDKIEANVPIDDSRFRRPGAAKAQGAKP